jgi:RNA 2',3'-cyclic 3'-phosphodiesterase
MPSLFTGLEIPSDLAMDLSMLRGGISGARWIEAENYHLTLRFIGDTDDSTVREIHATLEKIRRPPFTVTIEELGSFGGAKPRALVARAKPAAPLVELQAQQERFMRRIGIAPEPRKFKWFFLSSKENDRMIWARTIAASCSEKDAPMQTRGPAPKGR